MSTIATKRSTGKQKGYNIISINYRMSEASRSVAMVHGACAWPVQLLRLATFFHRENVYIFGTLKTTGFH